MKKINVRSILDPLSKKEMKNVTGGGEDVGSKWCCYVIRNSEGKIIYDQCDPAVRCSTDEQCQKAYGTTDASCTGGS